MTAARVQSKFATSGTGSVGISLTGVGSGNHLSCSVGGTVATSLTTSTPSATWSNAITDFSAAGGIIHLRADYTENVSSGSWTITGNAAGGVHTVINAYECSGVKTSSSLGVTGTGNAASTSVSLSAAVTPTAGSILITSVTDDGASGTAADTITSTGNTPFTVADAAGAGGAWDEASIPLGSAYFNNAAVSSTNVTWTTHNTGIGNSSVMLMEFLAAPPGSAPIGKLEEPMQNTGGLVVLVPVTRPYPW